MHDTHALPGADVVAGRLRWHVVTHGHAAPGHPPLLLLHGLAPASSVVWHDVARDLEHTELCRLPDLPGLGATERPAEGRPGLRLDRIAARLAELLDELHDGQVVLGGHGIGGAVAAHLAAGWPERVRALILCSAPLSASAWPPLRLAPVLVPGVGGAVRRAFRVPNPVREIGRAVDMESTAAAWRLVCAAPPPTLVLWGADAVAPPPAHGRALASASGGTFVQIADAGDLVPWERPERVAEEIAGFLAELG
ncbi:MAG TPA: alpha/beta fold hydrolase [Mycobacteriales bacterium]|nr:alpha/beta fold hydrolase [Mycobacteriales bacterium]